MKKILSIIFIMIFSQLISYSQTEPDTDYKIRNIHLEIRQSQMIPYQKVRLAIKYLRNKVTVKIQSNTSNDSQIWDYSRINKTFEISIEDFEEIKDSLEKIEIKHVFRGTEYAFMDGYTSYLTYGGFGGTVCLQFSSPTSRTQERGIVEYLNACILILRKGEFENSLIKKLLHLKTL